MRTRAFLTATAATACMCILSGTSVRAGPPNTWANRPAADRAANRIVRAPSAERSTSAQATPVGPKERGQSGLDPGGSARADPQTPKTLQPPALPAEPGMPRQGGDTCETATVITALPYSDTGTTYLYTDNYTSTCQGFSAAPDVVYSFTPLEDTYVDISLCGTIFDTVLYVRTDCVAAADLACNDDFCGLQSEIDDFHCLPGVTYYFIVDGYDTQFGDYTINVVAVPTPPEPPSCPEGSLVGRPPAVPTEAWAAFTSDANLNSYLVADFFTNVVGEIRDLHWWGPTWACCWSACTEDPMTFDITFYADGDGLPGAVVASFPGQIVSGIDTGLFYGPGNMRYFSLDLPTPVTLSTGWVSIQGTSLGTPDCAFLWMNSFTGPNLGLQVQRGNWVPVHQNFAFCFTGGVPCATCPGDLNNDDRLDGGDVQAYVDCVLGAGTNCECMPADMAAFVGHLLATGQCPPTGACCRPDGSCRVTTEAYCTGVWQGADTICPPNPCPQPSIGACCQTTGSCAVTTEANCTGTWLGPDTTCTPNPCPQPPCEDFTLTAPGSVSGNTCDAGDDCALREGEEQIVKVVIPTDGDWVFSLCNSAQPWDTYMYLMATCCDGSYLQDNDNGGCSTYGLFSKIGPVTLTAGRYYVDIEPLGAGYCGAWTLEAILIPPWTCPEGADTEQEPCGDDTNGGCNMTMPAFEPIECGETICGTVWSTGTHRDTDWYQVITTETLQFTLSAQAEFGAVIGLIEMVYPGSDNCADSTGYLNPYVQGGAMEVITVTTGFLPPGTYWFIVGPYPYMDNDCAAGKNDYWVSLTCTTPGYGACCNDAGAFCDLDIYAPDCLAVPGNRFDPTNTCTFDPPCGIGACCHDYATGPLCEELMQTECFTFPDGRWTAAAVCAGFSCPPLPPPNDLCENAIVLGPDYPVTVHGNTAAQTQDCLWPDMWYEVVLPYAYQTVNEHICGTSGAIEAVGVLYYTACGCVGETFASNTTLNFCSVVETHGWDITYTNVAGPGSIWMPIYTDPRVEFDLTIDVVETQPCVVPCPEGGVPESEACGLDLNGGCNMPAPTFEPIACGETVCGTGWSSTSTRDTDWYEIVVTEPTIFTIDVQAEFGVVAGMIELTNPGSGNCADRTGNLNPYALGAICQPVSVTTECMIPGTYWFFVGPDPFVANDCSSGFNDYYITLTCTTPPTGACCVNGVCAATNYESECTIMGGFWFEREACPEFTDCPTGCNYCHAGVTYCDEYISGVYIGTISNTSGCRVPGYSDYTSISTTVAAGSSNPITVTNPRPYYPDDQVTVWVDRDNNCAFDDYSIILSTADAATFTGNVDVPAGQAPGSYRMRIRIWFSSGGNPCGTEVYGEVEDYALIVP